MAAPQFDQEKNLVATISIFPVLFIIYFIAGNNSEYVKYCANQGIVFTIVEILLSVIGSILGAILGFIPLIGTLVGLACGLVGLAVLVFIIYQMYHAYYGTIKPIPVIGDIEIIK